MTIIINPGTGPVEGASFPQAALNMDPFLWDVLEGLDQGTIGIVSLIRDEDRCSGDDGRYGFILKTDTHSVQVSMPGIPIDEVRMPRGGNTWAYPRLYVDGSSWSWPFAVDIARAKLSGEADG